MRNHSYENDFDLHENETACRSHFHENDLALRLALKQRHKRTRRWPIYSVVFDVTRYQPILGFHLSCDQN